MTSWALLQIADSAFPSGGFAHSGGLEAMVQSGALDAPDELEGVLESVIWQAALAWLPIVSASHADPDKLEELDALAEAMTWSHVGKRASRVQGRAFLDAASRVFPAIEITRRREELAARTIEGHFAPIFGVVARAIGIEERETEQAFLHASLRAVVSAAVRLGVVGPYEGQAMSARAAPTLDAALAAGQARSIDACAQPAPIVELFQGTHDRLYSRLFQS